MTYGLPNDDPEWVRQQYRLGVQVSGTAGRHQRAAGRQHLLPPLACSPAACRVPRGLLPGAVAALHLSLVSLKLTRTFLCSRSPCPLLQGVIVDDVAGVASALSAALS